MQSDASLASGECFLDWEEIGAEWAERERGGTGHEGMDTPDAPLPCEPDGPIQAILTLHLLQHGWRTETTYCHRLLHWRRSLVPGDMNPSGASETQLIYHLFYYACAKTVSKTGLYHG